MKTDQNKSIGYSSLITLIFSVLWLVFMILFNLDKSPVTSLEVAIKNLSDLGWLFFISYLNAGIITLVVPLFLVAIYRYFRSDHGFWSTVAIIYVPAYLALNLIAYFSQLVFIPGIDSVLNELEPGEKHFGYFLFAHNWPFSFIGFINGLAYAVLGIPSIIFGYLSSRTSGVFKWGGIFLLTSGILSMVGFSGLIFDIQLLLPGVVISGMMFILSLIFYTLLIFKNYNDPKEDVKI